MRRVIIADLKSNNNHGVCTGHYYALAMNYREVFSPYCDVKIASGPIYLKKFDKSEMILLPFDSVNGDSKIKNLLRMCLNALHLFRHVCEDDVVIIQQSQPSMILFSLMLVGFNKSKVYQIQYSEEPMRRPIFRLMMKVVRKKICGLICPNETVGKAYGVPYVVVPDYIYVERESALAIPYSKKKYDFASVGRIAKDKGVAETAVAMAGKSYSYLIAGQAQDEFEKKSILESCSKADNLVLKLDYIDDDLYKKYISESRYCILNYQGTYSERSSGVVLDILFSGIPVVGRRCKALQFIEDFGMGVLYDDVNKFEFDSLLNESLYQTFQKAIERYKRDFAMHKQRLLNFCTVTKIMM